MEGQSFPQQRGEKTDSVDCHVAVLILSEVRFVREGMAECLKREAAFSVLGHCADLEETLTSVHTRTPDIVLIDVAFPNGTDTVRQIVRMDPRIKVVVFAISETEENIITWAEAGVAGYIPNTAAMVDLVRFITSIKQGEQICSSRVASGLIRRVASVGGAGKGQPLTQEGPLLTNREQQIVLLISKGLSNKDIARQLNIELSTTKTHVHNILEKLSLQRRGQIALRNLDSHKRAL